jgi:hypothetical protein
MLSLWWKDKMKRYYSIIFTIFAFSLLTQSVVPVVALEELPDENFEESPSPKASVKATTTPKPVATSAVKAATATSTPKGSAAAVVSNAKLTVLRGTLSATPSAVGKLLVKNSDGDDNNVDTDKNTKIFSISETGVKSKTTLSKFKLNDKVIAVGNKNSDGKSLLATYLIQNNQVEDIPRTGVYGVISTREASGAAAFKLEVKSPNKDEKQNFIVNADTVVRVKDIDSPKLSDIKIGDRVTLLAYKDEKTDVNFVTRIFVLPGRAAGLLRDIREASASASPATTPKSSAAASGSATVKATSSPTNKVAP